MTQSVEDAPGGCMRAAFASALMGLIACGDAPEETCAPERWYQEDLEVTELVALDDRLVIWGRYGLFGRDLDGELLWQEPSANGGPGLTLLQSGVLQTVTSVGNSGVVRRVSADGAVVDETEFQRPTRELNLTYSVITASGLSFVSGGTWGSSWWGTVSAEGVGAWEERVEDARTPEAPAEPDGAFAREETLEDDGPRHDLLRVDADGTVPWTVALDDPIPPHIVSDGTGGILVYGSSASTLRRYTPDGEVQWQRELEPMDTGPGLFAIERGFILVTGGPGDTLDLAFVDLDGTEVCSRLWAFDGTPLMDVEQVGDAVYLLTHDGLTKIDVAGLLE